MTKQTIVACLVVLGAAAPIVGQVVVPAQQQLTLLVDARYRASHGWGHVFECTVRRVISGAPTDEVILVTVYGAADPSDAPLQPFEEHHDVVMTFTRNPDRRHGPPPGFTDSGGDYWVLQTVDVPVAPDAIVE